MIERKDYMSGHQREWDESRSPQWKYLLSNENRARRTEEKTEQIKLKSVSKRKKLKVERKKFNKKGKPILYTATPTENGRWENENFKEILKEKNDLRST
jgi:hypothetical protein